MPSYIKIASILVPLLFILTSPISPEANKFDETNLNIAILGTGRMGQSIGNRLSTFGYHISYGSRSPKSKTKQSLITPNTKVYNYQTACDLSEIIFIALPWHVTEKILNSIDRLENKILVDITNALKPGKDGLMEMAVTTSAGELIQKWKPNSKVVKAFNTIGFHVISSPEIIDRKITVPIVGEDLKAKKIVSELIESMDFETIDLGPIRNSQALEMMSMLYMVPYLEGRINEAFEYSFIKGTFPKETQGVRPAN